MFDEDSYHAAMLFCKQLEADLQGVDLAAWVRSELAPPEPFKRKHKARLVITPSKRIPGYANEIRAMRKGLGLTQEQLGEMVGRTDVHKLETGVYYKTEKPYLEALEALKRFNCSLPDLFREAA